MGEDKDENDLLIKYGFPEDIWYVVKWKEEEMQYFSARTLV